MSMLHLISLNSTASQRSKRHIFCGHIRLSSGGSCYYHSQCVHCMTQRHTGQDAEMLVSSPLKAGGS